MGKRGKRLLRMGAALLCIALLAAGAWCFFARRSQRQQQEELNQMVQQYRQSKLAAFAAENEALADRQVDVAFIGDSLTEGYPLARFYPQYTVTNRGIGGDTTHTLYERLEVSVVALKPKVVVLLIGGNNLDTMFADYEDILRVLSQQLPETKVVVLSLTAMSGDWGHKNQLAAYNNVKIRLLAEKYGYPYVDLFTPLFDLETGQLKAEYTTDGAHLTEAGYGVLTQAITPVLDQLLAQTETEGGTK